MMDLLIGCMVLLGFNSCIMCFMSYEAKRMKSYSKELARHLESHNEGIRDIIELQFQILRKYDLKKDMEQELEKTDSKLNGEMHRWGDG